MIRPVRRCEELVGRYAVPGATTHVEAATRFERTATTPAYCGVTGRVEPAVRFQLGLPLDTG